MAKLSLIIITRNREEMLKRCLINLYRDISPDTEVIIVDNSDKPLGELEAEKFPGLRYIYDISCKENMPKARNRGLKEASGEIIAFIDDDTFVTSGWCRAIITGFADGRIGAVGGPVLEEGDELEDYDGHYNFGDMFVRNKKMTIYTKGMIKVEWIRGCNMTFQRELLTKLGGFDETYIESGWGEEHDICAAVRQAGYDIIYSPDAIVRHEAAPRVDYPRYLYGYRFQYLVGRHYSYFVLKYYLKSFYGLAKVYLEDTFYYFSLSLRNLSPKLFIAFLCNVAGKIAGVGVYIKKNV